MKSTAAIAVALGYVLQPDDVVFVRPVTVTLPYDVRLLPPLAMEGAISMFIWLPGGNFHMMANEMGDRARESAGQDVDLVRKTVTVSTSFASTYTVAVPSGVAPR